MKNNSAQPSTPGLCSARLRFNSFNSPFISPLRIVQSPFNNDSNFVDAHQANVELNHFQLEENNLGQIDHEEIHENDQEQSSIQAPKSEQAYDHEIILDQSNMLDFVLNNVNRNQKSIDAARDALQGYGTDFHKRLFDYLTAKFKKLKKTKEEMVKYCVRKSFKHITNKMRAADKEIYANMENNEVVAEYFQKHCEGDLSISMPFKKNSQQKTMNSNFLKKIFKCRQYNLDYKQFLRNFPAEYNVDNKKKIKSMNDAIKKCVKNKCFKSLDEYKRLPWTFDILEKIFEFAKRLMDHSPYKKQNLQEKRQENLRQEKDEKEISFMPQNQLNDEFEIRKRMPKKSIIILTPPMRPMNEPLNLPEEFLE